MLFDCVTGRLSSRGDDPMSAANTAIVSPGFPLGVAGKALCVDFLVGFNRGQFCLIVDEALPAATVVTEARRPREYAPVGRVVMLEEPSPRAIAALDNDTARAVFWGARPRPNCRKRRAPAARRT